MAGPGDCVFCRIVAGEISATVVRETDTTLAFRDVSPQAPVHVLVIPKEHLVDVGAVAAADSELLRQIMEECVAVAYEDGVADSGYRIAFNTGDEGGQVVPHCHAHVLGGRKLNGELG
ncbi:histidine triad nucleotide-binding protein [Tenggerimyces flavus]|uniref:Histidine triad nucleotide-binding protein n=1 Tax=Tenggerimyces flavus TaxID=1708749 RepID=A0ABV7YF79_9ACTN|nr:histidine triad nucleotide-binding protein [Tenggerimyces flavus]MBM7789253.1 histidine triad (HIT) family protein [Tenggerimyces flavus]